MSTICLLEDKQLSVCTQIIRSSRFQIAVNVIQKAEKQLLGGDQVAIQAVTSSNSSETGAGKLLMVHLCAICPRLGRSMALILPVLADLAVRSPPRDPMREESVKFTSCVLRFERQTTTEWLIQRSFMLDIEAFFAKVDALNIYLVDKNALQRSLNGNDELGTGDGVPNVHHHRFFGNESGSRKRSHAQANSVDSFVNGHHWQYMNRLVAATTTGALTRSLLQQELMQRNCLVMMWNNSDFQQLKSFIVKRLHDKADCYPEETDTQEVSNRMPSQTSNLLCAEDHTQEACVVCACAVCIPIYLLPCIYMCACDGVGGGAQSRPCQFSRRMVYVLSSENVHL